MSYQLNQDNRKSNRSGSRKRLRLVMAFVITLMVWVCATVWGQVGKINEKAERIDALDTKLAETRKINAAAKQEMERLNDQEYREEKARKELNLSRPGETVFDIPKANP